MSFRSLSLTRIALFALAAIPVVLTTGCGNMVTTAGDTNTFSIPGTMGGKVYGGNQPISNATVKLYAAGTTGYGSAGTLLATTHTSEDGAASFLFTQHASGSFPNTGPDYVCPSSNIPVYIISDGGDPLTNSGTNNNTAAAFIVGVGPCSTSGSQTNIVMNEVTTVATVWTLQQYLNPGNSTPGSASLGRPSTPQGIVGSNNGAISNLADVSTGLAVPSFTPPTGAGAAGITVTGTPESAKINTIANILASCVNNTSSSAANCTTLFANAVPPSSASVTSQPTATFGTAVDTIQAAYYMAINPADLTTGDQTNTKLSALYALSTANAAFQTALTAAPTDWTIGITYSATGTCTNAAGASFFGSMESIAVDASGNVWFNNGATAASNALGELSPTGGPQVCAFGNIPSGRGLTIDTNSNVWTTSSTTGSLTGVYEYLANGSTLNWATANGANGIVADGSGNVFYAPSGIAAPFQEYIGAASASSIAAGTAVGGNLTSSTGYLYVPMDASGRIWAPATSSAVVYELYPGGATPTGGYTSVDAGTTPLTTSVVNNGYGGAVDAAGNIFGGSTCCAAAASNTLFKIVPGGTPGSPTGSISAKFAGGVVAPRSSAVDGAGNIWVGMGYPVFTAAISPTGVNIFGIAEVDNNMNSISYSGPNGATGPATCSSTGTNCPTSGSFAKASLGTVRSLAIDPSGNVWAASSGTTQNIVEIVGAAVPVVTPLSAGIAGNKLGTKP